MFRRRRAEAGAGEGAKVGRGAEGRLLTGPRGKAGGQGPGGGAARGAGRGQLLWLGLGLGWLWTEGAARGLKGRAKGTQGRLGQASGLRGKGPGRGSWRLAKEAG
jgi:hypothetical protein